jgi:hypothetical protein
LPTPELGDFATELRRLRQKAGDPSTRTIEAAVHFSRTTVAEATRGLRLPSLPVTLALVAYFGGDAAEWEERWHRVREAVDRQPDPYSGVLSAFPPEPVRDGADPDAAGCGHDARTAFARKIARDDRRVLLGQIELRHSPAGGAAWGRFLGYDTLKHMAHRSEVEILVEVIREPDGTRQSYRDSYFFDYHWCDLLTTAAGKLRASATVFLDGVAVGTGHTDAIQL